MTAVKAILVDDERLARVNLRRLLESHPEIEIVGEAASCSDAAKLIGQMNPDLVFLDIQMNGETGFDLLENIHHKVRVIFVTAYDEYAIRAFEVNATDYLLKPVSPERLGQSLNRILVATGSPDRPPKGFNYDDSIYVRFTNSRSAFLKISSITHITPIGNYSRIQCLEGRHCLVLKTMKQWLQELPCQHFIRIHRSCIININQVERIEKRHGQSQMVYLKNQSDPLEMSRRFAGKLKDLTGKGSGDPFSSDEPGS